MDHGQGNRKRPIVHLLVEDKLVVDDNGEAEKDPYGDIGVRENDLLQNTVTERTTFTHLRENGDDPAGDRRINNGGFRERD